MTKEDKVKIVADSPEVIYAVRLLVALFEDIQCQSHIKIGYDFRDQRFELSLKKVQPAETVNFAIGTTIPEAPKPEKGEFAGQCNLTACTSNLAATWYNHSTRKFYCTLCAERLNNDEFNKRDALKMFGHALCTEANPDGTVKS